LALLNAGKRFGGVLGWRRSDVSFPDAAYGHVIFQQLRCSGALLNVQVDYGLEVRWIGYELKYLILFQGFFMSSDGIIPAFYFTFGSYRSSSDLSPSPCYAKMPSLTDFYKTKNAIENAVRSLAR
jgi:hypothetical protein